MALGLVIPYLSLALKFDTIKSSISMNNVLYGIYISLFYTLFNDEAIHMSDRLAKVKARVLGTAKKTSAGFEAGFKSSLSCGLSLQKGSELVISSICNGSQL